MSRFTPEERAAILQRSRALLEEKPAHVAERDPPARIIFLPPREREPERERRMSDQAVQPAIDDMGLAIRAEVERQVAAAIDALREEMIDSVGGAIAELPDFMLKGIEADVSELQSALATLRGEMTGRFDAMQGQINSVVSDIANLRAEMAVLRSELMNLADDLDRRARQRPHAIA